MIYLRCNLIVIHVSRSTVDEAADDAPWWSHLTLVNVDGVGLSAKLPWADWASACKQCIKLSVWSRTVQCSSRVSDRCRRQPWRSDDTNRRRRRNAGALDRCSMSLLLLLILLLLLLLQYCIISMSSTNSHLLPLIYPSLVVEKQKLQ